MGYQKLSYYPASQTLESSIKNLRVYNENEALHEKKVLDYYTFGMAAPCVCLHLLLLCELLTATLLLSFYCMLEVLLLTENGVAINVFIIVRLCSSIVFDRYLLGEMLSSKIKRSYKLM